MQLEELRNRVNRGSNDNASKSWEGNIPSLKTCMSTMDMNNFLRWPVIQKTMFIGNAKYIDIEYKSIVESEKWKTWEQSIKDIDFGNPVRYTYNPITSGNSIHCCYHLMKFQEKYNIDFSKFDIIYEFGGGYGCMAKSIFQSGFKGRYILDDFPIMLLLQNYYLDKIMESNKQDWNIEYLYDRKGFEIPEKKNSLFISTWALSETPADFRKGIETIFRGCKYILIAYQNTFDGVNNIDYVTDIMNRLTEYSWYSPVIKHMPCNNYLFGIDYYD